MADDDDEMMRRRRRRNDVECYRRRDHIWWKLFIRAFARQVQIVNVLSAVAIERVLASGEHVRSVFCVFTAKADIPSLVDWIFHSVACASVSVLIRRNFIVFNFDLFLQSP